MVDLEELPEEILLKIFSNVTIYELHNVVALVCKKFLRISRSPTIVKILKTNVLLDIDWTLRFYNKSLQIHTCVEEICNDSVIEDAE